MKIELLSLELNAFRDFDLGQTIELPTSQVTAVVGKNNDDGGSNGTGKSSFSMAAVVNLFGPSSVSITTKDLRNWHLNSPASIVGEYRIDGRPLIIDRVLGGKLKYKFDGSAVWKEGKVDDIQAEINSILKITPEQLQALSNKKQGEFGGFLLMKDSDKKIFLSSFFDVSSIERAKAKASSERGEKDKLFLELNGKLNYLDSIIGTQKKALEVAEVEFARVNSEETKNKIDSWKRELDTLKSQYQSIQEILISPERLAGFYSVSDVVKAAEVELASTKENVKTETDKLSTTIFDREARAASLRENITNTPVLPKELTDKKAQIEVVINTMRQNRRSYDLAMANVTSLEREVEQLRKQLLDVDNASCPSCGSPVSKEKLEEMRYMLKSKITAVELKRDQVKIHSESVKVPDAEEKQAIEFQTSIGAEISAFWAANDKSQLKRELEGIANEIALLKYKQTMLSVSVGDADRRLKNAKDEIKQRMESSSLSLDAQIKQTQNFIQANELAIQLAAKEVGKNQTQVRNSLADRDAAFNQRAEIGKELEILDHCAKITSKDGFIGYIFDSILEDLNSEINENIKLIPNARKFSLQFQSDKIVKSTGNVNKNITYQIMSGEKEIAFETLSGGEQLSAIIAVDEALDTVVSRRLGVHVGWKFLDEQFFWIDENSKEAILDFYRSKSSDKAYFIVDHASEFNASFDRKITIVKENDIARFV